METSCVLAFLLALPVWSMPVGPQLEATDLGSLNLLTETISAMLATMARLSKESQVDEDGHILRPPGYEDIEMILSENPIDETPKFYLASRINSEELLKEDLNIELSQTENEDKESSDAVSSPMVPSDAENSLQDASQQTAEDELNEELRDQSPEILMSSDIQETIPDDPESPDESESNILRLILSELAHFAESSTGGRAELANIQEMLSTLSKASSSPIIEENRKIQESTLISEQELKNIELAEHNSELEDSLQTLTDLPEDVNSNVEELLETSDPDGEIIVTNNEVPETVENETPSETIETEPELIENGTPSETIVAEPELVENETPSETIVAEPELVENEIPSEAIEAEPELVENEIPSEAIEAEPELVENEIPSEAIEAEPELVENETPSETIVAEPELVENEIPSEAIEAEPELVKNEIPSEALEAEPELIENEIPSEAIEAEPELVENETPSEAIEAEPELVEKETPSEAIEAEPELVENETPSEAIEAEPELVENETPSEAIETEPELVKNEIPSEAIEAEPELVENETPSETFEAEPELLEERPTSVDDESDNKEEEISPLLESDSPSEDLSLLIHNLESDAEEVSNMPEERIDAPMEHTETEEVETDLDNRNREETGIIENYLDEPKIGKFLYLLKSNANNLKRNIISSSDQRLKAEKSLLDLLSMIAYGASFLA